MKPKASRETLSPHLMPLSAALAIEPLQALPAKFVKAEPFIYLASQSPRRSQLLDQMGIKHTLLLPDAAEDAESLEVVRAGEAPLAYVRRVTGRKLDAAVARLALRGLENAPILCADTTVALGREIFGKPASPADAERMLLALSGKTHRVLSAVALHHRGQRYCAVSVSRVSFQVLSDRIIAQYIASGEPFGKAGAYAVQGKMAIHIHHISGSYSGIMGLPVFETGQLLQTSGWLLSP